MNLKTFNPLILNKPFLILIMMGIPFISNGQIAFEKNGYVEVEAEKFEVQEKAEIRKWHIISKDVNSGTSEELILETASNHSYIRILPDTRVTHQDTLIHDENFSNEPGKLAVISYPIQFNNAGKYFVWVRTFSTGSEDNGVHVGLNGTWPESGQRMQWCEGKDKWTWESKQRTEQVHCGEEKLIYLDIEKPGVHIIMFSMREDGFAMDKWAMSLEYINPETR